MMMAMAEKEVSPAQLSTAESLITLVQGKVAGTEGRHKERYDNTAPQPVCRLKRNKSMWQDKVKTSMCAYLKLALI